MSKKFRGDSTVEKTLRSLYKITEQEWVGQCNLMMIETRRYEGVNVKIKIVTKV